MKHLAFIPARSGSKGIKFKNRKLLKHTINFLSNLKWIDDVIVSTDDEYIKKKIVDTNYIYLPRKKKLCGDNVSIKAVMEDFIKSDIVSEDSVIWLFYLTIPIKIKKDFDNAKKIIEKKSINSLISFIPAKTHPFSCWRFNNGKTEQYLKNDIFRRQNLPLAYTHHHYLCAFKPKILTKLNNELIYKDTKPIFFKKTTNKKFIEIDHLKDLNLFKSIN